MDDAILSFDELKEMSGYKTAARICDWLKLNRIPFLTNGRGRPLVSRLVIRQALGETNQPTDKAPIRSINIDKLERATRR